MDIKFDNFVTMMMKDKTGESNPQMVIRFLVSEEDGKERKFEHVLSDEEAQKVYKDLQTKFEELIQHGIKELVKEFEGHVMDLKKGEVKF